MSEQSLKFYQGTGYGVINNFLRDPDFKESVLRYSKTDSTVAHINNIDESMSYNNLGETYYYRGIPGAFIPQSIQSSSSIIVNTSFTSTTSDQKNARSFVDEGGCCVLVFKIPDNLKTYIYTYKGKYKESEILVQRNTQFKIKQKISRNIYLADLYKYDPPKTEKIFSKTFKEKMDIARAKILASSDDDWSFEDSSSSDDE